MPASYATHRKQLELILRAWGMPEATAVDTAEIMSWADLHGIDTHGISMVPVYDERRRGGKIDMKAEPVISRERRCRRWSTAEVASVIPTRGVPWSSPSTRRKQAASAFAPCATRRISAPAASTP